MGTIKTLIPCRAGFVVETRARVFGKNKDMLISRVTDWSIKNPKERREVQNISSLTERKRLLTAKRCQNWKLGSPAQTDRIVIKIDPGGKTGIYHRIPDSLPVQFLPRSIYNKRVLLEKKMTRDYMANSSNKRLIDRTTKDMGVSVSQHAHKYTTTGILLKKLIKKQKEV